MKIETLTEKIDRRLVKLKSLHPELTWEERENFLDFAKLMLELYTKYEPEIKNLKKEQELKKIETVNA